MRCIHRNLIGNLRNKKTPAGCRGFFGLLSMTPVLPHVLVRSFLCLEHPVFYDFIIEKFQYAA